MIKTIWSRYAKGIVRTDDALGTNGTPPTDPFSEPTSEMESRLRERLSYSPNLSFHLMSAKASFWHLFGIHTMIEHEEWDFDAGTVRLTGRICWKCEREE